MATTAEDYYFEKHAQDSLMTKTLAEFMTQYKSDLSWDDIMMSKTLVELEQSIFDAIGSTYKASDTQVYYDETEYSTDATSFEKQTEVTVPIPIFYAKFRVSCQAKPEISGKRVEVAIYKNGVLFSTVQEVSGVSWEILTWDLFPWTIGDTIELWVRGLDAPQTSLVRYFGIYGTITLIYATTTPSW